MDDLISRQAALDMIHGTFSKSLARQRAEECIKRVPATQAGRKKGRWLCFDPPWYRCSECGAVRENKSFMENFCPNCGADMRQEERDALN